MDGARRFIIGAIAVLAIISLLAFARNSPGVGGREPDPPSSTVPAPASGTTVVHVIEIRPPSSTDGPPATSGADATVSRASG